MRFGPDSQAQLLADTTSRWLAENCTAERVRHLCAHSTASCVVDEELETLALNAALVPQAYGGQGLGLFEAALIQEQLGASVAPASLFTAHVIATIAAMQSHEGNSETGRDALLADIAHGAMRPIIAIAEIAGQRADAGVALAGGCLAGKSLFACGRSDATHALVGTTDSTLAWAKCDDSRMEILPLPTIDRTRAVHELRFCELPCTALVTHQTGVERTLMAARILLAADTLGAATTMLQLAIAYAGERRQFGRAVGSFQAVKHLLAEMAARLEPCRAMVWQAAYAFDRNEDQAGLLALLTKAHLAEVGQFVARSAIEVHGGMGFTDLSGLHLWFKRIGANRQQLGGPERLREEAARLQGWF